MEWDILENQSPSEHNWGWMYSYVSTILDQWYLIMGRANLCDIADIEIKWLAKC